MHTEISNSPMDFLSSTHANALAETGSEERDIKEFLFQHARIPALFFKYCSSRNRTQLNQTWQWLNHAPDDSLVPVAPDADDFQIVVVNDEGPKSAVFTAIPGKVTVPAQ